MVRYLTHQIQKDLKKKMVFLGGPRQVGKTTLARTILKTPEGYLNWDTTAHRENILKQTLPDAPLLVFDELHKYRQWRNYLKGLFDDRKEKQRILVTGSARLDFYRFGGDSLQGRYHYLRLHPLSVAELHIRKTEELLTLLQLGGFPEPYFGQSEIEAKRWSREYRSRFVRDEITSLEQIHDIGSLELLMIRLPELVGSPLSIDGMRQDLQTSHKTVSRWLEILERLYSIFRLSPFGSDKIRAVKKEQKHYHLDWSVVPEEAFRFENMVACHLLKWVDFEVDTQGRELELRYFRDVDKREVDFVITENRKPIRLIECKWKDDEIGTGLKYMKTKYPSCEAWQISAVGKKDYISKEGVRVCPAVKFLSSLV